MSEAQVLSQRQQGYRWLRFSPELERQFQKTRANMMRERARPVAASALLLFLFYSVLDWWFFPASLSSQTVAVRLLVVCPIILSVLVLSYRMASPAGFALYYTLSYLWGGLSLLFIIWLSRLQNIPMPYDGVLLMLMFGFFLMGLPFRSVTVMSTVIVGLYITLEVSVGAPARALLFNIFFLVTAYLIGVVGAWLQEYQLRTHFLDRTQLALSRSAAMNESARKTDVLAAAGHDLRQPLNVINLLLENLDAEPDEVVRAKLMAQLRRTLAHYGELLSSLLDLSRLREGVVKPRLNAVAVSEVLGDLVAGFATTARESGIRLSVPGHTPLLVNADPALLHRVLQNLLANALAHSGADTVTLEVASQFEHVRIWVKDNGRGVARESEAKLFEAFYRGGSPQGGLGLGLAIVRQLARLMQGRCGYEPAERGSAFWVELPRAAEGKPAEQPVAGRPQRAIVLVEDHSATRDELSALLENWGFQVTSYDSAEAALEGASPEPQQDGKTPFILVTDLHLPGVSGFDLIAQLRAQDHTFPAIVMTGDSAEQPRYDPAARTWILKKPLVPGKLRAALLRLQRQDTSQQARACGQPGRTRYDCEPPGSKRSPSDGF